MAKGKEERKKKSEKSHVEHEKRDMSMEAPKKHHEDAKKKK